MRHPLKRYRIEVAGPIGVGKSSLLEAVQRHFYADNIGFFPEPIHRWSSKQSASDVTLESVHDPFVSANTIASFQTKVITSLIEREIRILGCNKPIIFVKECKSIRRGFNRIQHLLPGRIRINFAFDHLADMVRVSRSSHDHSEH